MYVSGITSCHFANEPPCYSYAVFVVTASTRLCIVSG